MKGKLKKNWKEKGGGFSVPQEKEKGQSKLNQLSGKFGFSVPEEDRRRREGCLPYFLWKRRDANLPLIETFGKRVNEERKGGQQLGEGPFLCRWYGKKKGGSLFLRKFVPGERVTQGGEQPAHSTAYALKDRNMTTERMKGKEKREGGRASITGDRERMKGVE